MERVSLTELLAATGGAAVGFDRLDVGFEAVANDSRTSGAGDLFWALRGDRHDGHDFVQDALARGAAACIVQADKHRGEHRPAVLVRDTLEALWDLARWYRRRLDVLTIAVTGSVGKTTTREMIHAALGAGFAGTRSPHNYNNHIGVPLSILGIERHHDFAVLEIGASRVGEIHELAGIAVPQVGVVTAVGPAHLDGFGDEDEIVRAKGELIEALPKSGLAVLAGDDPRVRQMAVRAACRVVFVGEGANNDLRATDVEAGPNRLRYRIDGDTYELPVTGRHHLTAALCATAVAREIGMSPAAIAEGLDTFTPARGRCRPEQIGAWIVIDDTYNANPSSMQAACEVLKGWAGDGSRILVAGDMLELGCRTEELHVTLGRTVARAGIDHLLAYGGSAHHVIRGAREAGMDSRRLADCREIDDVSAALECRLEPGDVVLVKGSRGMRMERVIDRIREHAARNSVENNSSIKNNSQVQTWSAGRVPREPATV